MTEIIGAHVKFTGNSSSLQNAVKPVIGLLDQYGRQLVRTKTAEQVAADSSAKLSRSYNRLKAQIDPVYASTVRYEKSQRVLKQALDAGIIGLDEYNHELQQAALHYGVADKATDSFNRQIRTSRFHSANLAAQFNDIGVMLASGQSPFILAMQQGTQVTQVLQTMGGTGRQQLRALKDAFLAVLSPTTALTIAVIAGTTALAQWALGIGWAADEAEKNKKSFRSLTEEIEDLNTEFQLLTQGFRVVAQLEATKRIADAQKELNGLLEEQVSLGTNYETGELERALIVDARIKALKEEVRITEENLKKYEELANAIDDIKERPTKEKAAGSGQNKLEEDAARALEEEFAEKERFALEIERIMEEYATKLELEQKFHDDRQTILLEALDQQLITQQEYNALIEAENEAHQDKMRQIEAATQATRLRGMASFMGAAASVFEQGSAKMMKIAKVFGASEALINAWVAYSQALREPGVPTWAKMALALKVLAAGLGAVAAIKSVGKGGTGKTSADSTADAGSIAAGPKQSTTAVNINVRGQVFDRGAVIGLIDQINEAVGDGARIRTV